LEYKRASKSKKICAVVKADGYGVGVNNFVKEIENCVDCFAVACFVEAKKLRKLTKKPILVLNYVPKQNLRFCVKDDITISVYNICQLKEIVETLKNNSCEEKVEKWGKQAPKKNSRKTKLNAHIAINSGMNRIGISSFADFKNFLSYAKKHKDVLNICGIFTHIYNANSKSDTDVQMCIFNQYLSILKNYYNIKNITIHAEASLAGIKYENYHFDMTRLGIGMFGSSFENFDLELCPVIEVKSKIIDLHSIKEGESVGYDKKFVAKKDMIVATVPIGYADGIFRNYAKKGYVLINNKFCKIVGNLCMDMFMCDVTSANAKLFDEVILIGKNQYGKAIKIECVANECGTIPYEILTSIKQKRFNIKRII
jgi:alanine racemase